MLDMPVSGLPSVSAPSYPLSRDAFAAALQKGLGRALIHLREQGGAGFEALLREACLHNQAYDPQCEADRGPWLMLLLDAAGLEPRLRGAILEALRAGDAAADCWDVLQLCQLAELLARRGVAEARDVLHAAFRPLGETDDLVGGPEIIALDGADGLRFVASRIGEWLAADQRAGVSEMPVVWFDEQHGEGAAAAVLRSAAGHDPNVARYLAYLDGLAGREIGGGATFRDLHQLRLSPNAQQAHAARWRGVSAADVIREIEQAPPGLDRFGFQYWGVHASSADLEAVLGRLVAETEPGRLCKYLHIFWRRAMPRLPAEVPALADHADADVRRAAIRAMAAIRHPAARALALRRLAAQRHDDDELNLLVENYEPGDAERIARQVAMPDDPHRRHSLIMDLVHVFERNATPEAAPVMLFCYEHTPCSNCRRKAVGVLLKAGVAPAWLVEECRCDVDDGTRKLVEAGGAA